MSLTFFDNNIFPRTYYIIYIIYIIYINLQPTDLISNGDAAEAPIPGGYITALSGDICHWGEIPGVAVPPRYWGYWTSGDLFRSQTHLQC